MTETLTRGNWLILYVTRSAGSTDAVTDVAILDKGTLQQWSPLMDV